MRRLAIYALALWCLSSLGVAFGWEPIQPIVVSPSDAWVFGSQEAPGSWAVGFQVPASDMGFTGKRKFVGGHGSSSAIIQAGLLKSVAPTQGVMVLETRISKDVAPMSPTETNPPIGGTVRDLTYRITAGQHDVCGWGSGLPSALTDASGSNSTMTNTDASTGWTGLWQNEAAIGAGSNYVAPGDQGWEIFTAQTLVWRETYPGSGSFLIRAGKKARASGGNETAERQAIPATQTAGLPTTITMRPDFPMGVTQLYDDTKQYAYGQSWVPSLYVDEFFEARSAYSTETATVDEAFEALADGQMPSFPATSSTVPSSSLDTSIPTDLIADGLPDWFANFGDRIAGTVDAFRSLLWPLTFLEGVPE